MSSRYRNASQRDISYNDEGLIRGQIYLRAIKKDLVFVVEESTCRIVRDLFLKIVNPEVEECPHVIQEGSELLLIIGSH